MNGSTHRPGADVVAFPGPEARPPRRPLAETAPRGRILLYTGVRYERRPDAERPQRAGDRRRQG